MTARPVQRIAGFGLREGASLDSLRAALRLADPGALTGLATIAERAKGLSALAAELGLPLHIAQVRDIATPAQSDRVLARFGTGSVAEAAALYSAGKGARLIAKRVASADGMATCAIAEGEGI